MTVNAPIAYQIFDVQSAQELVPGTLDTTPVWKKFHDLSFVFDSSAGNTHYQRQGSRGTSANVPGRRVTTGTVKGPGNFNEAMILLAMANQPTKTTIDTSGAFKYVIKISPSSRDVPGTRSFQWSDGTASRGYQSLYTALSGINLKTTPDAINWDGKTIGRARSRGITVATGATIIPQRVIDETNVAYYLADTLADLDAADPLALCYGGDVNMDGIWSANNPANRAHKTFTFLQPGPLKGTGQVMVAANDTDSDMLEDAYHNITKLAFRIEIIGPQIGLDAEMNPVLFMLQVDTCISVNKEAGQSNVEEGLVDTYTFDVAEDDLGNMVSYTVISDQSITFE